MSEKKRRYLRGEKEERFKKKIRGIEKEKIFRFQATVYLLSLVHTILENERSA